MTEPEVQVEPQTVEPEKVETQSAPAETPQETSPTLEQVKALIDETWASRKTEIDKELESAYKTLRRGEAKSDTAQKRIEKLEGELLEVSLRGLEPQQQEVERLKRQVQREADSRTAPSADAEVAKFNEWSRPFLEEEGIPSNDATLTEAFQKYGEGWTTQADLKVALTRAVAQVRKAEAKKAVADSAEQVKKAREEERAKARNTERQSEGKLDRGTPAASNRKDFISMSDEEWKAFNASRRR